MSKYSSQVLDLGIDNNSINFVNNNINPALIHNNITPEAKIIAKEAVSYLSSSVGDNINIYKQAISDFDTYFPAQNTQFIAELAINASGHIVSASGTNVGSAGKVTSKSFSRARSYKSLKGFKRIGGVLIGKSPENTGTTEVQFTDISWKDVEKNHIEIILTRKDRKRISAGIFEKDIVAQALAYVSDGRLVTATMVKADPIPFLKIFLHPTLANTELGCHAIDVDRFVDKYTPDIPLHKEIMKRYEYQEVLYKYMFFKILQLQFQREEIDMKEFEMGNAIMGFISETEPKIMVNWSEIYDLLEKGEVLKDKSKSHIAAHSSKYNSEILEILYNTLSRSETYDQFLSRTKTNELVTLSQFDVEKFFKNQTELWSGVRESSYSVDEELNFLKEKKSDFLYPLLFIRQVVFSSSDEDEENSDEEKPWEFPEFKNKFKSWIIKGIEEDNRDNHVVKRMKSFTMAQRLFRVILDKDLGKDFPIEKLVLLMEDVKNHVNFIETPTWNVNINKDLLLSLFSQKYDEYDLIQFENLLELEEVYFPKNLKPCK